MALAETLEFIHILFVFVLLGSIGMIAYSSVMLARTDNLQKFEVYLTVSKTGGMIAGMSTILVGVFGVLAAWKIGWSLTEGWLIAAYIALGVTVIVPPFTFKPWGEKAEKLMDEAHQEGHILPEQKKIMTGIKWRAFEYSLYGLLVFIAYLMVFKPF
ncbi:MAG: DUF2269 family protein [Chloroflexi bacterium]|nr:DUF2269 family protein [Chloroflexota bacterium]